MQETIIISPPTSLLLRILNLIDVGCKNPHYLAKKYRKYQLFAGCSNHPIVCILKPLASAILLPPVQLITSDTVIKLQST